MGQEESKPRMIEGSNKDDPNNNNQQRMTG